MVEKLHINTERIRFIGFLFFKEKSELADALHPRHKKRHFDRLWNGTDPCLPYYPSFVELGFNGNFIVTPYPPEIGSLQNKEALNIQGIGIPRRPFSGDPQENFVWKDKFLNLSVDEQMNRIDAYCADIRKFRKEPRYNKYIDLASIPNPPSQETIDRLVHEFHYELNSPERRDRIVEWFSYQHPY